MWTPFIGLDNIRSTLVLIDFDNIRSDLVDIDFQIFYSAVEKSMTQRTKIIINLEKKTACAKLVKSVIQPMPIILLIHSGTELQLIFYTGNDEALETTLF